MAKLLKKRAKNPKKGSSTRKNNVRYASKDENHPKKEENMEILEEKIENTDVIGEKVVKILNEEERKIFYTTKKEIRAFSNGLRNLNRAFDSGKMSKSDYISNGVVLSGSIFKDFQNLMELCDIQIMTEAEVSELEQIADGKEE